MPGPAVPFAETLSPFFADFGVSGTLAGQPVTGIFDGPGGTFAGGVGGTDPQFTLPAADVPAAVFGATLVIPQGTYQVRESIPDGTGLVVLLLTKA